MVGAVDVAVVAAVVVFVVAVVVAVVVVAVVAVVAVVVAGRTVSMVARLDVDAVVGDVDGTGVAVAGAHVAAYVCSVMPVIVTLVWYETSRARVGACQATELFAFASRSCCWL